MLSAADCDLRSTYCTVHVFSWVSGNSARRLLPPAPPFPLPDVLSALGGLVESQWLGERVPRTGSLVPAVREPPQPYWSDTADPSG